MKVACGPSHSSLVGAVRVTEGQFTNGANFIVDDNWKQSDNPHELLRLPWTGTTFLTIDGAILERLRRER